MDNSLYKQLPHETILKRAADLLRVDTAVAPNFKRIPAKEKEKRNLLIYLLWETGRLSNHEIGLFFGLGHSAISRYAGEINKKLSEDRELKQKLQSLRSKIKKSRPDNV